MAKKTEEKTEEKATPAAVDPDAVATVSEDERVRTSLRSRQFPSLYAEDGGRGVEVAERTADTDAASTTQHTKDFVVQRVAWEQEWEPHENVHNRNKTAVRQFMVNAGLRPDAQVVFEGEHDHPFDGKSLVLRYTVEAVPAVVATDFDLAHTVIPENGPTPTERAETEARKAETVAKLRDPLRDLGNEKAGG